MPLAQAASTDLCEALPPGRVSRIIQIHPSLRCNLSCKHCYSSSGPGAKPGLEPAPLINLLEQAAPLGYNVVSLSGGEPFLYPHLGPLAQAAKQLGYYNSVTTNAMLLSAASKQQILPFFDLVAVSVDGREANHDLLRDHPGSFAKMLHGVDILKAAGREIGFIHTALPRSWQLLPWLAEFAQSHGARLLHIHPLEHTGRAANGLFLPEAADTRFTADTLLTADKHLTTDTHFTDNRFTAENLHKLYIAAHYLQAYCSPDLFIQLDLLHRDNIIGNRSFHFPHPKRRPRPTATTFSHLFGELIVNEHGDLLPIAHGCSNYFRIGNIHSGRPLDEMIEAFIDEKFTHLLELHNTTYDAIAADPSLEIVNWSERLLENSHVISSPHPSA
ncbi:MAG TPA: radical SAM protein [Puia sp.]|nr:radical SAM protein [Puia sp.]